MYEHADLAIIGGRVYTFDARRSVAEAVVIKGGRIIYVGSVEGAKKYIGSGTEVIEAKALSITPGLIDTHAHLAMWGLYSTRYIDLSYPKVDSIKRLVEVVKEYADKRKKGEWILGRGWNHALYPEGRPPTRWDLDQATENHPVFLWHTSGHMAVANSVALELAGINERTRDPVGGVIERDERGVPTGVLAEKPAIDLVARIIPKPSMDEWVEAITYAMREWVSEGVTAVKDPTAYGYSGDIIRAYQEVRRRGAQILRIVALYWAQSMEELKEGYRLIEKTSDSWLRVPGIKVILDGALSTKTAWISRDYKGSPGNKGLPTLDINEFREMVLEASSRGYMVSVHAIGDIAIEETIAAYEQAVRKYGASGSRYTVIHFMLPREDHIERLRSIGGFAEIQSGFIYFLAEAYYKNLDEDMYNKILPVKSMIEKGLTVCNGSDAPVIPYPPRYGLYAAVSRLSFKGLEVNPREMIGIEQALATYTSEAAKCLGMEDLIGSIEPGKLADLVIWDRDLFSVKDPKELLEIKPLYTMIEGRIVYRKTSKQS